MPCEGGITAPMFGCCEEQFREFAGAQVVVRYFGWLDKDRTQTVYRTCTAVETYSWAGVSQTVTSRVAPRPDGNPNAYTVVHETTDSPSHEEWFSQYSKKRRFLSVERDWAGSRAVREVEQWEINDPGQSPFGTITRVHTISDPWPDITARSLIDIMDGWNVSGFERGQLRTGTLNPWNGEVTHGDTFNGSTFGAGTLNQWSLRTSSNPTFHQPVAFDAILQNWPVSLNRVDETLFISVMRAMVWGINGEPICDYSESDGGAQIRCIPNQNSNGYLLRGSDLLLEGGRSRAFFPEQTTRPDCCGPAAP